MISFTLKCSDGHTFDSWFQSASAFETLQAAGRLECAVCGVCDVSKAIMSPRVSSGGQGVQGADNGQSAKDVKVPELAEPHTAAGRIIAEFRRHVEKNSDYVGTKFAKEARAMHLGEKPDRPIYGQARPDEARALIEDGIRVLPLPFVPKQKVN